MLYSTFPFLSLVYMSQACPIRHFYAMMSIPASPRAAPARETPTRSAPDARDEVAAAAADEATIEPLVMVPLAVLMAAPLDAAAPVVPAVFCRNRGQVRSNRTKSVKTYDGGGADNDTGGGSNLDSKEGGREESDSGLANVVGDAGFDEISTFRAEASTRLT